MSPRATADHLLDQLQADAFACLCGVIAPNTGLVRDSSLPDAPASIAACGMALLSHAVAAQRGFITRSAAAQYVRSSLIFLLGAPQGAQPNATGHHGFFYHFLDPSTGRRTADCELSTIDTAIFIAAALLVSAYFDGAHAVEREIRTCADALYQRVDWAWAMDGGPTVSHGWKPESGFLAPRWEGYSEGLFLYILALGSPTHPVDTAAYEAWTRSYRWESLYDIEYLHAGPLFIHQMSHYFLDLRGIADAPMRARGSDYAQNSRRATMVQQRYAMANPLGFRAYGQLCWGITACDGPGPLSRTIDGVQRDFLGYAARGAPFGPEDGTIAPWAMAASLPFAPEIVTPSLEHIQSLCLGGEVWNSGCLPTFNATVNGANARPWVADRHYPLNQCPVLIMLENARSGAPWSWSRRCPAFITGLRAAGFTGGWLDQPEHEGGWTGP